MDRSYSFAVLQALPDKVRAERVNVGVVVASTDGIDLRAPELRKLRILTGHEWHDITAAYDERLNDEWKQCADLSQLRERIGAVSEIFSLSQMGSLVIGKPEEYEESVAAILHRYVDRPKLSRREKQQKINAEIARTLRNAGVLQAKGETIDSHKVVQRYVISQEKDIVADFAYKNGSMKVVSTLDLRSTKSAHSRACEKGATLFFAKQEYGSQTRPFGVYAVSPEEEATRRSEIEILSGFADGNVFNWLSIEDRQRFSAAFY
jgi:hypothetical protein